MPIVDIDLSVERPAEQRVAISEGVHRALRAAVGIPAGDCFHIVTAHPKEELRADPRYLGVSRQDVVYVRITLVRGRSRDTKLALYRAIADELAQEGVRHDDVAIVLTENSREDYSRSRGEAQLLDLGPLPGVEDN